ncbi:MAG: porin [Muribaculaceae bacterium]|nr:porin [Muribaculaceae bacterium]
MKHFTLSMACLASMLAPCAIYAQNAHPSHQDRPVSLLVNNLEDSVKVIEAFKENSPAAFNVTDAPRFAIVGKNNMFYLGIGATIKGTLGFDFGDPIDNANEFVTSDINMNPVPGNGGKVNISAQQSNIYLNMVALPDNPNKIGAYISFNLLGNNYTPALQYAYLKYRGFTVGYDYSLFADMAAGVPTIDYEGPNAMTSIPNAVIDYRHSFNKHWSIGAGLELPIASYTAGHNTSVVSQRVPDVPFYVQYAWGHNSWVRMSGMVRNMIYRDLSSNTNRDKVGWGIKVSGSAEIVPNLRAYYQGAFGKGLTSYFQDLEGCGLDMTPDMDEPGRLNAVMAWGAYGGLQYNFSPKVYCSATYSHLRNYAKKYNGDWPEQYRYGQYAVGNVFYNINSVLTWGVEYIWGRRVDMNGLSHHDNRIQTMLQLSL